PVTCFGSQLPLVQGVSLAGVPTMPAIMGTGALAAASPEAKRQAVFGAVIAASLIGLVVAPFFAKIARFFPPVVTGTVITVIGLSLMREEPDDLGEEREIGRAHV